MLTHEEGENRSICGFLLLLLTVSFVSELREQVNPIEIHGSFTQY